MELDWPLPQKKESPLYLSFTPEPINLSQDFMNPFLGYPTCPIIGRYNRGQYRIGQTLFQLEFKCRYSQQGKGYECGGRPINVPKQVLHNLRNIPEAIPNNKAAGVKNSPEILPEAYPVRQDLSIFWIVSFGELGKDFLNYLNHMYVLAPYLFVEERLKRNIHYLPIYAYLPQNSGLNDFQIERGLNYNNYRGQYMSFHLAKGAPAFSPNNMRLSLLGGKIIATKQPQNQQKKDKQKKKYVQKQKAEDLEIEKIKELSIMQQQQNIQKQQEKIVEESQDNLLDKPNSVQGKEEKAVEKIQIKKEEGDVNQNDDIKQDPLVFEFPQSQATQQKQINKGSKQEEKGWKKGKKQKAIPRPKSPKLQHQGFINFYTSVLLQNDYRLYYHWHIEDRFKQDIIKQIWNQSRCVEQFITKYQNFGGKDPLVLEAKHLLFPKQG